MMSTSLVARGLVAACASTALLLAAFPSAGVATGFGPDLRVTLESPQGDIEYPIELGVPLVVSQDQQRFAVQVIDGCGVNGYLWVLAAGLSPESVPVRVADERTADWQRFLLPAFEPGSPVAAVLDPEALRTCQDAQEGGLPPLTATATFTAVDRNGSDATAQMTLLSDGRDHAYARLYRDGESYPIISKGSPVVAVDSSPTMDQLLLLAEGRTPGTVEGVVFSGPQGMLPSAAKLRKNIKPIRYGQARRAFEAARNGGVPGGMISRLGLKHVGRVHHVSLDFSTLGARYDLAQAGWIDDQRGRIEAPALVEPRFAVELVNADGSSRPVALTGPLAESSAGQRLWQYSAPDVRVEIIDACDLSGTFWIAAGAVTDEPIELDVTDTSTGTEATVLLWTDRQEVSRAVDTAALTSCP
jgi:hypothetical protein